MGCGVGKSLEMKICLDCVYLKKGKKETHSYVCVNPKGSLFNSPFPHTHKKTRKACKRYKEKGGLYIDLSQIEGIRFIEHDRGKFQGSDIWVIGCGPNLDLYPDDFFDDKISITLNWSCVAFPDSTYFTSDGVDQRFINTFPHSLKKCIIPVISKSSRGRMRWGPWGVEPIYMRLISNKDAHEHTKADFERMAGQVFGTGSCEFVVGMTSACVGVQIAAVLGAKRIILVGCFMNPGDAQKRGMSEFYTNDRVGPSIEWRIGQHPHQIRGRQSIARFAEIFKGYGVEVVRHRFDEEKGKYEFVEVKSEREDLWDIAYGRTG